MSLEVHLTALNTQSRDLNLAQQAKLSCDLAKQFEKTGDYDAACEALLVFWPDRNRFPRLTGLDQYARAEVLLRVGNLAGWLGSSEQTRGSQETAKDLITRSLEDFAELGLDEKIAEARGDLALCYWREGSFDEARVQIRTALQVLPEGKNELRAVLLVRAGIVEEKTQQLQEALRFYYEAAPLVDRSEDHALQGALHNGFATLFTRLGTEANRRDYLDKALIEGAAASFHFEQAGNTRYLARVENNLGFLFFTLGQYREAHKHLDRARYLFLETRDRGTAAQIDETRARTLLAEGKLVDAERVVRSAVKSLERGGEQAVLAEALNTHGIALARLGHHARSRVLLERAVEIAQTTGDLEGAGRIKLSIIEELGDTMSAKELISTFRCARALSKNSQDPLTLRRLIASMEIVMMSVDPALSVEAEALDTGWEGFSLKSQILNFEKSLLERALRDAGGSVTRAAQLLGFRHHQSLIALINGRHRDLLKSRSAIRKRRRHLFSKSQTSKRITLSSEVARQSQVSVLQVEENKAAGKLIAEALASNGIDVDSCVSGTTALKILTSDAHYDLIIVENDLPGLSGLELVRRVRNMARWRATPIIMLSGDDCEKEAWRTGVDEFLRKPEDIDRVSSTVERLLEHKEIE
jgi:CheY-like chemotaxis protein/Flp pilus assembly protein TadD